MRGSSYFILTGVIIVAVRVMASFDAPADAQKPDDPVAIAAVSVPTEASPVLTGTYTEKQLALARQVGAVIILARDCGINPTAGVRREMLKDGLDAKDLDKTTKFGATMLEQATSVVKVREMMIASGQSAADNAAQSCKTLCESYGPNGIVRPGLGGVR